MLHVCVHRTTALDAQVGYYDEDKLAAARPSVGRLLRETKRAATKESAAESTAWAKLGMAMADAEPLQLFGAGDAFGDVALLTGTPRAYTAVTLRDTKLVTIRKRAYDKLVAQAHARGHGCVGGMCARARA